MKKKKILFVVGSFQAGGAEKSLVSFLNTIDPERYDVFIHAFSRSGLFEPLVPSFVRFLDTSSEVQALRHSMTDWKYFFPRHLSLWIKKFVRTTRAKMFHGKNHVNQQLWQQWQNDIPAIEGKYDIAIGSQEGFNNYMVIEKVHAKRKILWIHSQYEKLCYNKDFDAPFFDKADAVITISATCLKSLEDAFPSLKDTFCVLPNITNADWVRRLSESVVPENFFDFEGCKIITVGRLSFPKNYNLAIEAASLLKKEGFCFRWIVIGEGPERKELTKKIKKMGLADDFLLIGLRANPYSYISKADLAVQSSFFEGKSIFADEAKILNQVFVSTNYDTVYDQIEDGKTGIIVEMTAHSLCEGIMRAYRDKAMRDTIKAYLKQEEKGNTQAINDYYKVYEGE